MLKERPHHDIYDFYNFKNAVPILFGRLPSCLPRLVPHQVSLSSFFLLATPSSFVLRASPLDKCRTSPPEKSRAGPPEVSGRPARKVSGELFPLFAISLHLLIHHFQLQNFTDYFLPCGKTSRNMIHIFKAVMSQDQCCQVSANSFSTLNIDIL